LQNDLEDARERKSNEEGKNAAVLRSLVAHAVSMAVAVARNDGGDGKEGREEEPPALRLRCIA
jgi:hypothetical protein